MNADMTRIRSALSAFIRDCAYVINSLEDLPKWELFPPTDVYSYVVGY